MSKKSHPADVADLEAIATATHFNVHLRLSPSSKINERTETLAEAVVAFDRIKLLSKQGRMPIIYAITPEDNSIPVPPDMIVANRKPFFTDDEIRAAEAHELAIVAPEDLEAASEMHDEIVERLAAPASSETVDYAFNEGVNSAGHPATGSEIEIPAFLRRKPLDLGPVAAEIEPPAAPIVEVKRGKHAEVFAAAERGEMPLAPDFSKPTHASYRKRLAALVTMVETRDVAAIEAFPETHNVKPLSDSRKILLRYRDLALIAIKAQSVAA